MRSLRSNTCACGGHQAHAACAISRHVYHTHNARRPDHCAHHLRATRVGTFEREGSVKKCVCDCPGGG
jgi:hypothetical protein